MKIKNIGSNRTEVNHEGKLVLVSYETPVAYIENNVAFVSDHFYSRTTTKHINKWLDEHKIEPERTVKTPQYDVELVFDV